MLRFIGSIVVPAGTSRNNTNTGCSRLDLGPLTAAHFDSVLRMIAPGVGGDAWQIRSIGDSPAAAGVSIAVAVGPKTITVHFEDGVSTIADFEAAVSALAGTDRVFAVDVPGTGATILAVPGDEFAFTNFAGGATGAFVLAPGARTVALVPDANVSCEIVLDPENPSEIVTTAASGYAIAGAGRALLPVGRVSQREVIALFNGGGAPATVKVWVADGPIG